MTARPIIIVTGANNGIGFGICRRLLAQLAQLTPADSNQQCPSPPSASSLGNYGITYPCESLTLIMACRSPQRAEAARDQLLQLFEGDVAKLKSKGEKIAEHVDRFKQGLVLKIHKLDLASVKAVFEFGDEVQRTYPYISHVICNAGVAPFLSINWFHLARQLATNFMGALTYPRYNIQEKGLMSDDGLGWVWQCNVFGHYVLVRSLQKSLSACPSSSSSLGPARVLWMSSLEANPEHYDFEDWQLTKSKNSYEGSKYQMELIGSDLDRRAVNQAHSEGKEIPEVRHFVVHPGVVYTSIDAVLLGAFLHRVKSWVFYLARWLGSPHHNITAWNGAAAAVHITLVSLVFLPTFFSTTTSNHATSANGHANGSGVKADAPKSDPADGVPVRYHSVTNRRGVSGVDVEPIEAWAEFDEESRKLVDRCERLYQTYRSAEGRGVGEQ